MVRSGGSSGSAGSSWTDERLDGFGARFEYQQEKCQRPHSERDHSFFLPYMKHHTDSLTV